MAQADLSNTRQQSATHNKKPFFSSENSFFWLIPGLGVLLAYSIFPLIFNMYLSFNEWNIMAKEFRGVGFENWGTIFGSLFTNSPADPRIQNSLIITFQYVAIALIIQLILGLFIALLLDAGPWAAGLWQSLMILPMVIAPAIAGMMYRLLLHSEFGAISWVFYQLGVISPDEPFMGGTGRYALVSVLMVDVWQWTSFFVIILLAGLRGMPQEILEAAEVDGANWFQRLWRIKIPLLRSVIIIAVLFRFIDLYRVFDYIVIMTSGGPGGATETLSFYGYVNTFQLLQWGYGAAISILIVALAWLSAYIFQTVFKVEW